MATTEIYTLSLHDALPIFFRRFCGLSGSLMVAGSNPSPSSDMVISSSLPLSISDEGEGFRSEEHTSELQSLTNLVCRLLLEKKKKNKKKTNNTPKNR